MRRALIGLGALAVLMVVLVLVWTDDADDPANADCGPIELEAPEVVEARAAAPPTRLEPVVSGVSAVAAAQRADGRLLVFTRPGALLQVDPASGSTTTLFEQELPNSNERGALGLAIDPAGTHLYISYTPDETEAVLEEFALTPDGIDLASRRRLTAESNPNGRHLLANLAFGPDGYLYVGVGDAGTSEEDAGQYNPTAQDLSQRKGKIWRIDPRVDGAAPYAIPADNPFVDDDRAAPEVYLYGFRNPWRFSFDRATGDLWLADAGEYCAEEIDHIDGDEMAGANLGWGVYEGFLRFSTDAEATDVVPPVYAYPRSLGEGGEPARCAVIGGYVYRGTAIPELQGSYVFSDYCTGRLEVLRLDGDSVTVQELVQVPDGAVQSLAEGTDGELYALGDEGVFALRPG